MNQTDRQTHEPSNDTTASTQTHFHSSVCSLPKITTLGVPAPPPLPAPLAFQFQLHQAAMPNKPFTNQNMFGAWLSFLG
eukprot:scaffold15335_cov234-Alexandrium_tamarense.AAC.6